MTSQVSTVRKAGHLKDLPLNLSNNKNNLKKPSQICPEAQKVLAFRSTFESCSVPNLTEAFHWWRTS